MGAYDAAAAIYPCPKTTARTANVTATVRSARAGDEIAWTRLVERYDGLVRGIARRLRLSSPDVEDVVQTTWLNLFTHIDGVRDESAIGAWLARTAGRESLRVLQKPAREHLTDDPHRGHPATVESPEAELLATERRDTLARAVASLPDRQRRLMTLLAMHHDPDYKRISEVLRMPIGSIGPTRRRSLARLRDHPELQDLRLSAG